MPLLVCVMLACNPDWRRGEWDIRGVRQDGVDRKENDDDDDANDNDDGDGEDDDNGGVVRCHDL